MLDYAEKTGVNAVGLDTAVPLSRMAAMLPKGMPVQGNLDPMRLVAGGPDLDRRVREIVERAARPPAHLQPRPWRRARNADRACRTDARRAAEHGLSAAKIARKDRRRPVQSRRARRARRRAALPEKPVQRSGDHPLARAGALLRLATDLEIARAVGARELRQDGRRLSPAPGDTQAGGGARCRTQRAAASDAKSFIAMRYWKPYRRRCGDATSIAWGATKVVLLPLYPQFSTTTTASSLKSWKRCRRTSRRRRVLLSRRAEIHRGAREEADQRVGNGRQAGECPRACCRPTACPKSS